MVVMLVLASRPLPLLVLLRVDALGTEPVPHLEVVSLVRKHEVDQDRVLTLRARVAKLLFLWAVMENLQSINTPRQRTRSSSAGTGFSSGRPESSV